MAKSRPINSWVQCEWQKCSDAVVTESFADLDRSEVLVSAPKRTPLALVALLELLGGT